MKIVCLLYEAKMDPSRQIEALLIQAINSYVNLKHTIQKAFQTNASDQCVFHTHHPGAFTSKFPNCNHHYTFNAPALGVSGVVMI